MKRSLPISDYLYGQKDLKMETVKKLSEEMNKFSNDSVHVPVNKESEVIVDKLMNDAFEEIFNLLDSNKQGKINTKNCNIEGILIISTSL
jgi:division protein CdvB (Snf7/Vps24/ESCRT-III family)